MHLSFSQQRPCATGCRCIHEASHVYTPHVHRLRHVIFGTTWCTHVHTHACTHVCTHVRTNVCAHVCTRVYTHVCTHVSHISAHTHACTTCPSTRSLSRSDSYPHMAYSTWLMACGVRCMAYPTSWCMTIRPIACTTLVRHMAYSTRPLCNHLTINLSHCWAETDFAVCSRHGRLRLVRWQR